MLLTWIVSLFFAPPRQGEAGYSTVEMTNSRGRPISPADVMFTVSKLSRMSQKDGGDVQFDGDVGKIQVNQESGNAVFDMGVSYNFWSYCPWYTTLQMHVVLIVLLSVMPSISGRRRQEAYQIQPGH